MANLVVKGWGIIDSYGDDFNIEVGPPNPREFCLDLRIDIGEIGEEGVSNYQVIVTTPLWLISNFSEAVKLSAGYEDRTDEYIFGRGILIVREYNIDLIERFI